MPDTGLTTLADAALTDEQHDFVEALRGFCAKEVTRELLAAHDDDHHSEEIARRMAADLLAYDGWNVAFVGADVPPDALAEFNSACARLMSACA